MDKFVCQYCYVTSDSALSAAHHVCGLSMLKDRIDGLEAHCKMWHREAMRLATKYNEDTFYYSQTALEAADEAPDNPLNTEADKQRAARRAVEAESKLREAVK